MPFPVRRVLLLTLLLSLSGVFLFAPAAATLQGLQVGMEGPEFSLKSPAGESRTWAGLKGEKLTIVVFWSTWSRKSDKALARMQQLYGKYGGKGLSVVAVNADGQDVSAKTRADANSWQENLKIGFPMMVDEGLAVFREYGVIALPTIVVMDKDRVIRYELSGYPLIGSEALVDYVVSALEGKAQAVASAEKGGYQPNKNALRFFNMGKTTLKSKRMADTAETWFKKAIDADPQFVLPHLSLGKLYLQRGDGVLAQKEFKEALNREPGNPIALCESGMILVNEGKTSEATPLFEAARKVEDAYAPCYYYAGYAYGKEGRLEDAMKMFDEAEKVNPFDYNIFVYKGKVFEGMKEQKKVFEAYRKALQVVLQLH